MDKCAKVSLYLLYLAACVLGVLAVVLPFWVSTEKDEGPQEVHIYKQIDSGLWWKYERFEVKSDSFPESDEWWQSIVGTSLYTGSVRTVTGLMLFGLVVLTFSFICTLCIPCFRLKNGTRIAVLAIGTVCLAVGFIASGPVIYYLHILDDYEIGRNAKHLGWSFWLAIASALVTFVTALYSCYLSFSGKRTEGS